MDYSTFINRVTTLATKKERYYIIDPELPVASYLGHESDGNLNLLFEDIGEIFDPETIHSTEQIQIHSFVSSENKACLSFTLLENRNKDIYYTLCFDLIEASRKSTRKAAVASLLERFSKWQDLFKNVKSEKLSIQQQQGLIAELLALEKFANKHSFSEALRAWEGPLMKEKDFQFHNTWAEIKSCPKRGNVIDISSIEQLDSREPGSLLIYHFDLVSGDDSEALSLNDAVVHIASLATTVADQQLLNKKLLLAGYSFEEDEYTVKHFKVISTTTYVVSEDFPRLTREAVPTAIISGKYKLDLAAIESYKRIEK